MGVPKYTLPMHTDTTDRQPLLVHLLTCHHQFQLSLNRRCSTIYISTRSEAQRLEIEALLALQILPQDMGLKYVTDHLADSGPIAGLLAAYLHNRAQSWIVTGCDYPFISTESLERLYASHNTHHAAVTCFVNDDGITEPLLAIWTPPALSLLEEMSAAAKSEGRKVGPNKIIQTLRQRHPTQSDSSSEYYNAVNLVKPRESLELVNINTPVDWQWCQQQVRESL